MVLCKRDYLSSLSLQANCMASAVQPSRKQERTAHSLPAILTYRSCMFSVDRVHVSKSTKTRILKSAAPQLTKTVLSSVKYYSFNVTLLSRRLHSNLKTLVAHPLHNFSSSESVLSRKKWPHKIWQGRSLYKAH